MIVKVYTLKNCKYCDKAKEYLKEQNIECMEIDLSAKENREARKYYRSLGVTVAPIITGFKDNGDEWIICGFDEDKKKEMEKILYD